MSNPSCATILAALITAATFATDAAAQGGRNNDKERRAYEQGFRDGRQSRLEVGRALTRDRYEALDPDDYRARYGRSLPTGQLYAESDGGVRILLEATTGLILDILDPPARYPDQRDYGRGAGVRVPPGHYPPRGACRIWFPDRPPGQQPPPGSCQVRVPRGAVLIEG